MSNDDLLVDAVKARLAQGRGGGSVNQGAAMEFAGQEPAAYTIELEDLSLIAARHRNKGEASGHDRGYREGYTAGMGHGERYRATQDFELLSAVIGAVSDRLDRASAQFKEPADGGRDRRDKGELRREALQLIDGLRAGLSLLLVQVSSNEFNLGES